MSVHGGGACAGGGVGRAAVPGRRGGAASRQSDAGASRQVLALRARRARAAKELRHLISGTYHNSFFISLLLNNYLLLDVKMIHQHDVQYFFF